MRHFTSLAFLLLSCLPATFSTAQESIPNDPFFLPVGAHTEGPVIAANDNRNRAGYLENGRRHINLVVSRGILHPEDESQPGLRVEAIGESSETLTIPAPLLRFTEGETVSVTIFNALPDSSVTWFGLHSRPLAEPDSLILTPGESQTLEFNAGEPGTYMYRARIGWDPTFSAERDLTAGAFIVDPAGVEHEDRVFVMNIWSQQDSTLSLGGYNTLLINGKSWPHTERLMADVGVTENWHVINATVRDHPMHLHGFYFDVLSLGTIGSSTAIAPDDRREFVTQTLRGYETMQLEWTPAREGDWLFHCHLSFHVSAMNRLPGSDHGEGHMAGLVLGISVRPGDSDLIEQGPDRHLTLTISESEESGRFEFSLEDSERAGDPRTSLNGPMLDLKQYQTTHVTVVNNAQEPTGIHWHGLELDAWSDGVPDFSASDGKVSPKIAPGSSFTYKLTLMRPGTFMYHTHLNDISQLARGLYGPITVTARDANRDHKTDHPYILGWRRFEPSGPSDVEVNGIPFTQTQPEVQTEVGTTHTLRVMNMAAAGDMTMYMQKGDEVIPLLLTAKDGAELPEHLKQSIESLPRLFIGETTDVEFTPEKPGTYSLHIGYGGPFMTTQTWHVK